MFGKNRKEKLQKEIEQQKQKLAKMEEEKMKFEIKDGSIKKKEEEATKNDNPFDSAVENTKQKSYDDLAKEHQYLLAQQKKHIEDEKQKILEKQREDFIAQQQYQLRMEQEQMMRGPNTQPQFMQEPQFQMPPQPQQFQMPPQEPQQAPQENVITLTIYLTEKEVLQPMPIRMEDVQTVVDTIDRAIVEQTIFKFGGLTINGLYIKRYTFE